MEQPRCTVVMDGVEISSEDFVAVLSKENGDASILFNTDALTMGMATKLIMLHFVRMFNEECSAEEQAEITGILGDIFVKMEVDNNEAH